MLKIVLSISVYLGVVFVLSYMLAMIAPPEVVEQDVELEHEEV